jgi:hypothetical protein
VRSRESLSHSAGAKKPSPFESDAWAGTCVPVSAVPALPGTSVADGLQRGTADPRGIGKYLFRVLVVPLIDRFRFPRSIIRGHKKRGGQQE